MQKEKTMKERGRFKKERKERRRGGREVKKKEVSSERSSSLMYFLGVLLTKPWHQTISVKKNLYSEIQRHPFSKSKSNRWETQGDKKRLYLGTNGGQLGFFLGHAYHTLEISSIFQKKWGPSSWFKGYMCWLSTRTCAWILCTYVTSKLGCGSL